MSERHIVALGGGGIGSVPYNPLLGNFILGLSGKRCPRICFLATASGDAKRYIQRFYKAMSRQKCEASHLGLYTRTHLDPAGFLLAQDVIYVGGGNTANMLAIWRIHGVDRALQKAWRQGIVLAGVSAGANCWFEACSTDSFGPLAPLRDGLGLLPGSVCPHYDGEKQRRPTLLRFIASGQLPDGLALDDGAAVHFIGRRLVEAVSSRPQAKAYSVVRIGERLVEEVLPTRFLGVASNTRVG
jgi:dipeptidase E